MYDYMSKLNSDDVAWFETCVGCSLSYFYAVNESIRRNTFIIDIVGLGGAIHVADDESIEEVLVGMGGSRLSSFVDSLL